MNSLTNPRICSAATNVAAHGLIDVGISWFWFFSEQHRRTHDLTRLTVAALRYIDLNPRALKWVTKISRQSLNRCNVLAGCVGNFFDAGPNRLPIKMNSTRTTLCHAAAVLGSC